MLGSCCTRFWPRTSNTDAEQGVSLTLVGTCTLLLSLYLYKCCVPFTDRPAEIAHLTITAYNEVKVLARFGPFDFFLPQRSLSQHALLLTRVIRQLLRNNKTYKSSSILTARMISSNHNARLSSCFYDKRAKAPAPSGTFTVISSQSATILAITSCGTLC